MVIDKQAVSDTFSKAAHSYDQFAGFQREVGSELLELLEYPTLGRTLDLGCGTGYFSAQLALRASSLFALDLSPQMAAVAANKNRAINAVVGDADHLPFADQSLDTVFSSLVLQWCADLIMPLTELRRVATQEVVFSTLVEGSLIEFAQSWQQVDGQTHINTFLSKAQLEAALKCAGIHDYHLQVRTHTLHFEQVRQVMVQLKGIGASHRHQRSNRGLGGARALQAMVQHYEQYRGAQGLPVTYQVAYVRFKGGKR